MENTLSVSKSLNHLFKRENGTDMDQMRMHKMMYLAQRESLMYSGEPLFDSEFQLSLINISEPTRPLYI